MRACARACVRVRVRACVPSAAAVAIQLQPFCHAENQLGRVVTQGTLRKGIIRNGMVDRITNDI